MSGENHFQRVDRSVIEVHELGKEPGDRAFWLSRPPEERLQAAEFLRQTIYGYDAATARLSRVLEVVELGAS
jgi:hypothetical protein